MRRHALILRALALVLTVAVLASAFSPPPSPPPPAPPPPPPTHPGLRPPRHKSSTRCRSRITLARRPSTRTSAAIARLL